MKAKTSWSLAFSFMVMLLGWAALAAGGLVQWLQSRARPKTRDS
jgi:hypothetical protein